MKKISRSDAVILGKDRFYTGSRCKLGHLSERYTVTGYCVDCCEISLGRQVAPKPSPVDSVPDEFRARVISRQDAISRGLKRYFTGIPCRNGHVSERSVRKMQCIECKRIERRAYRRRHPSGRMSAMKGDKDKRSERARVWRQNRTPEQIERDKESRKRYFERKRALRGRPEFVPIKVSDPDAYDKERAANALKRAMRCGVRIKEGMRRIDIINETVPLFRRKRELEHETGVKHHVDHIVPLFAGGAHSTENLQVLSSVEHYEKGRRDHATYSDYVFAWLVHLKLFVVFGVLPHWQFWCGSPVKGVGLSAP